MLVLQHFLGQPIGVRVGVVRELAKLRVDAPACLAAEQVREVHGAPAGRRVALPEPLGRAAPRARSAPPRGSGRAPGPAPPAPRSAGASAAAPSGATRRTTPTRATATAHT